MDNSRSLGSASGYIKILCFVRWLSRDHGAQPADFGILCPFGGYLKIIGLSQLIFRDIVFGRWISQNYWAVAGDTIKFCVKSMDILNTLSLSLEIQRISQTFIEKFVVVVTA